MSTQTTTYWIAARLKDGGEKMHYYYRATLDEAMQYAHEILDDAQVTSCVPVKVTMTHTDIEIRRPKK